MSDRALDLAPAPTLTPSEKLRLAVEMANLGIAMKRASLRREDPDASEELIEARWRAWLSEER